MTPETQLLTAVVEQAIRDLSDPCPAVRGEANSFFFAGGSWGEMRKIYLDALGIELEPLRAQLRKAGLAQQKAPEPRNVARFTLDHLRALIPDKPFRIEHLDWPEIKKTLAQLRIKQLHDLGEIERIGHGWYGWTHLHLPRVMTDKDRVLAALTSRPQTLEQLAARIRPPMSTATISGYCVTLVGRGEAMRCDPGVYQLRTEEAAQLRAVAATYEPESMDAIRARSEHYLKEIEDNQAAA